MKNTLESKCLYLRAPRKTDIDQIYLHAKDPEIARYTTLPQPYTRRNAQEFIVNTSKRHQAKDAYRFAIVWKETGKLIGMIGLEHVSHKDKNAEIGYWIGKQYWGRGIVQEAIPLVLRFGFRHLRLERIYAKVFHKNFASAHVLEKNGFKREGTLRKHIFRNNEWFDEHHYGLLRKEWR